MSNVDFYRISVSLLGFGLSSLSSLIPLLINELNKQYFSFLICLCGSLCLLFSFPINNNNKRNNNNGNNNNNDENNLIDSLIPIGCLLMAICQVILKNISNKKILNNNNNNNNNHIDNPNQLTVDDIVEECDEGEIELMIPQTSSSIANIESLSNQNNQNLSKNRVTLTEIEVIFYCLTNLMALFVLTFQHGVEFSSKEHVGYGKLISTLLIACFMSITQGVLIIRTVLLNDKYLLYVLIVCCGYPMGILFESLFPFNKYFISNFLFINMIQSISALSHGVLLYTSLMALTGSEVRAKGHSTMKICGIFVGTCLALTLLYVNQYL